MTENLATKTDNTAERFTRDELRDLLAWIKADDGVVTAPSAEAFSEAFGDAFAV